MTFVIDLEPMVYLNRWENICYTEPRSERATGLQGSIGKFYCATYHRPGIREA